VTLNPRFLLVALSLLASGELQAQAPRIIPDGTVREGALSFDGRATTGGFTGTTQTVQGEMTGGASLADVRGWVEAPVSTLVTGNDRRDRDLNKSMASDLYPTMRFDLTGVTPGAERGDTTEVMLQGRFTIRGVTREADIPATVVREADVIRVHADTPLSLKDYKVEGLSKLMGALKMYDRILLHIDVTFAPTDRSLSRLGLTF
jgi:polyisoprenoid-binding protein YceI